MSRRGRHRRVKVYDEMHRGERRVFRAAAVALVVGSAGALVAATNGALNLDGGEWVAVTSFVMGASGLWMLRPR